MRLAEESTVTTLAATDGVMVVQNGNVEIISKEDFEATLDIPESTGNSVQTLTDGTTVTWNLAQGNIAKLQLGGNRTLVVNGTVSGDTGILYVNQDTTGNRTLALPGVKPATLALSSGANEFTALSFVNIYDTLYWTHVPYGVAQVSGVYQSESDAYFSYLSSENAGISTPQKQAIDDLVVWLKTENLYTGLHDFWLMPSATSKVVARRGFKGNLLGAEILDVDFTISANGLSSGTKGLKMGISPATIGTGNHQISAYIYSKGGGADATFQMGTCATGSANGYSYISSRNATLYAAMSGAGVKDSLSYAAAHVNGLFTVSKPAGELVVVRNGTLIPGTPTSDGDVLSTHEYMLFGLNSDDVQKYPSSATIPFACIGKTAMTGAQAQTFYTKVQAIQTAFNRAV